MVKQIMAELGEECKVDVDILHETLLQLPAEKYLDLFKKIHEKIYGYPPFIAWNNCGGACGTIEDEKAE